MSALPTQRLVFALFTAFPDVSSLQACSQIPGHPDFPLRGPAGLTHRCAPCRPTGGAGGQWAEPSLTLTLCEADGLQRQPPAHPCSPGREGKSDHPAPAPCRLCLALAGHTLLPTTLRIFSNFCHESKVLSNVVFVVVVTNVFIHLKCRKNSTMTPGTYQPDSAMMVSVVPLDSSSFFFPEVFSSKAQTACHSTLT